jgi:hypothetical protein
MTFLLLLACPGKRLPGDTPTGEELFTAHIEASIVGDDSAWDRATTRIDHGSFSMPRQGIESDMLARYERPNHYAVRFDFPGIGLFEEGFDGTTAWSVDPTQGPRVKEGDEVLRAAFDASFDGDLDWQERYTEFRVMGLEECNGEPAWEVRAITKFGDERRFWFDRKTGLIGCSTIEQKGAFGSVKSHNRYEDYTEFDGRLLPATLVMEAMMLEIVMQTDVVDLDPREFEAIAPPLDVQALLDEDTGE